jgi:galactokinase
MDKKILIDRFYKMYGDLNSKPVLFFSPGRVNLIGEHTDYNGGYVFPCALNFGTYLLIRKSNNNILRFSTLNLDEDSDIALNEPIVRTKKWTDYPIGVLREFLKKKIQVTGLELLYYGDVPNGAGLSSSASIEMVTAIALNDLFDAGFSTIDMVKMSQRAENEFVEMNCGIMDQFAVGFGKKNHAVFLNCKTLGYEQIPIAIEDHSLVITNTNKRRGLTDSKYNERRNECEKAVCLLQRYKPIKDLSDITFAEIKVLDQYIEDSIIRKRAKHVISENDRTLKAVEALRNSDIRLFGELMNLSNDSLKNDYEVTGYELDTLVYEGRKLSGVTGMRMTGAGFGGCTVSLVKKENLSEFMSELYRIYKEKTGIIPDFYLPLIDDGARKIQL